MEKAAELLQGVRITSSDFEAVLQEPGEDVFIYLDPPYVCDSIRHRASRLYHYTFRQRDHVRLREAVGRCPHRCLVSYDDDPLIRDLYADFDIQEASWTYSFACQRYPKRELLIANYSLDRSKPQRLGTSDWNPSVPWVACEQEFVW